MEAGPRDLLKVDESNPKEQRRIQVGDDTEVCVLVLPASVSAGDVPFTLSLGPPTQTRREA